MKPVLLLLLAIGRRGAVGFAFMLLGLSCSAWILSSRQHADPFFQWVLCNVLGSILAVGLGVGAGTALPALQAHTPLRLAPGSERSLRRLLWSLSLGISVPISMSALLMPASLAWWMVPWSLGHMTLATAMGVAMSLGYGLGMSLFGWGVRLALVLGGLGLWHSMGLAIEAVPMKGSPGDPGTLGWLPLSVGIAALLAWAWAVPRLAWLLCDSRARKLDPGWLTRTVVASELGAASSRYPAGDRLAQWLTLRPAAPWRASPLELGALVLLYVCVGAIAWVWTLPQLGGSAWAPVLIWAVLVTLTALPWLQMPWMSPRALLVPGGLQRDGLARQLFGLLIRRNSGRALFETALLSAALSIGWLAAGRDVGLGAFAALLVIGAAMLPANFAVSMALLRLASSRWRESSLLLLALQPLASMAALGALGLRPRLDDPATLWIWAALSWPISLLITLLLLRALARPLELLDLGRMPASPMSGPR